MKENINIKDKKGSISIFVLVGLLFMSSFLLISYAYNVNKSKIVKEQFDIISDIYSHKDGDEKVYERAYTALRKKNKQTLNADVENASEIELTKTFEEKVSNYRIYGAGNEEVYQKIEYIESTGTQYIDIGYNLKLTSKIDISLSVTEFDATAKGGIFGSYEDNALYQIYESGTSNEYFYASFGNNMTTYKKLEKISLGTIYDIHMENGSVQINDNLYTLNNGTANSTIPMYLFYRNSVGTKAKMKLYSCQIYEEDTLVRDLVPCYKIQDNSVGMYDLVYNKFYPNSGTGKFVVEENVDSGLESSDNLINKRTLGIGDLVTDLTNVNYGKYNIKIKITNLEGESITKDIILNNPLFEEDYIDFKTRKVVRADGTEEYIDLPELLTFEDYTKIEVITENKPSKIEVEYTGYTID